MIGSLLLALACNDGSGGPSDGETPGTGDSSAPADTGDTAVASIDGFALAVDTEMALMIHATFADPGSTEAWVEYRFEGDAWRVAPTIATGEAVILGVPEQTTVEARAVAIVGGGTTVYSESRSATTGSLPPFLLRPTVAVHDEALASAEGYAMVSVSTGNFTFQGPYAVQILDRSGRIVWYHRVPDELFSLYPSVAFDGTHIWYDAENIFGFASGAPHVTRMTLDGRWKVELPTPGAGQAYAEGPDGSFFYELRSPSHGIAEIDAAGDTTLVWDCDAHLASIGVSTGQCLLNACNWDPTRGTLLASQFLSATVFEIELATGQAVRQFGQLEQGAPYAFDPAVGMFAYQHWPHWTPQGTLFVSTHLPCGPQPGCDEHRGQGGVQVAAEYVVDDDTHTITRIWSHESTDLWATQAGEAYRLPNGNFIHGYGQDGAVREYTGDGQVAWEVSWPKDGSGYRAIGHVSLIADLYALNRGQ